ncbi:hypothetical protein HYS72_00790 [Candidatus Pacearchaeota archaeon]|nr:hypothetical protein [Candidatus Pacearchaeota archaeon]MBI2057199.1 hypothetical protein [Candidatus Pacearchaeota archaeon]
MKNLFYAVGIFGAVLAAENSYSQTKETYVKIETVEKKSRELDNATKNFAVSNVYTTPTSIPFDSLDERTKNRVWQMLSNQYEIEREQYENELKDYEGCKTQKANLEENVKTLSTDLEAVRNENKSLKLQIKGDEKK